MTATTTPETKSNIADWLLGTQTGRRVLRAYTATNTALYRRTGGRVRGHSGVPLLLLTVAGRKSGKEYTMPLGYTTDGDTFIIAASAGGSLKHPVWWLNLRDSGTGTVQIGRETFAVHAEEITEPAERERLWGKLVALEPNYARITTRTSPVIALRSVAPLSTQTRNAIEKFTGVSEVSMTATTAPNTKPTGAARLFGSEAGKRATRMFTTANTALYQRTSGRVGGHLGKAPVLLLTVTGRKSGKAYVTPLCYATDGDTIVIPASAGGSPKHPAWWLNLRAHPETSVQVGRETLAVRAEEITEPTERERLWEKLVAVYPGYESYAKATTRTIPVIALRPVAPPSTQTRAAIQTFTGTSGIKEREMFQYRGNTALITGASTGIGAAFARELAARGMSVVLVARSEDKLRTLADEIVRNTGVRAEVITADVSEAGAAREILRETEARGVRVHLLVNNAGFATHGAFETLDPERERAEVLTNVAGVVDMAHAFLPQMVGRGAGGVINVASTAAFQPLPYMAVYAASKAFVLSFSEALYEEYRTRGIRILALCPGATETPFFEVVGAEGSQFGTMDTPEHVVATGLQALERGKNYTIAGPNASNYLLAQTARFAPRWLVARIAAQLAKPREDHRGIPQAQEPEIA